MSLGLLKTSIKTTYDCPSYLSDYQKKTIHYAVSAYMFLLPNGSFTYEQFAEYINRYYDTKFCPQNREVVKVLKSIKENENV